MASDLKALFFRAVNQAGDNRGKPAVLGRFDGTLFFTDDAGTKHLDRVWVGIGEGEGRQETVAYLGKVAPQRGLPVRVDLVNGIHTVIDIDRSQAVVFGNGSIGSFGVAAHAKSHGRLGPDPLYITGLQFLPLQAHPTSPPSMAVTVEQGSYRWQGTDEIWQTADSGDLSAYIPGSAANKHFIILALDRSTGALVEIDGDDIDAAGSDALFGTGTLTADDVQTVLDVGLDPEYWPICAILFYNGMTSIKAKDIVFDLRPWGAGGSGVPGGSDGQIQYNNGGVFDGAVVYWDDVNGRFAVGTASPAAFFEVQAGDVTGHGGLIAVFQGNRAGTNANVEFMHDGDFDTGNRISFAFPLNTDLSSANQKRTAVAFRSGFTVVTDASRTSTLEIGSADGGTFSATRIVLVGKRVGIDAASPAASAKLEIGGTDGAVLLPRLTTTQRDALTAAAGMILFNSSTNKFQGYDGSNWVDLH